MRKNEVHRLKWKDIGHIEGVHCIIIRDTKNHRPHYVSITSQIQKVLNRAESETAYVFPSTQKKDCYIGDVRPTLRRLSKMINVEFKCHDVRRTFAARASEVRIDYQHD